MRREHRDRDPPALAQLAHVELALGLESDDEEEERHQPLVDPVAQVRRDPAAAEIGRELRRPHRFVAVQTMASSTTAAPRSSRRAARSRCRSRCSGSREPASRGCAPKLCDRCSRRWTRKPCRRLSRDRPPSPAEGAFARRCASGEERTALRRCVSSNADVYITCIIERSVEVSLIPTCRRVRLARVRGLLSRPLGERSGEIITRSGDADPRAGEVRASICAATSTRVYSALATSRRPSKPTSSPGSARNQADPPLVIAGIAARRQPIPGRSALQPSGSASSTMIPSGPRT